MLIQRAVFTLQEHLPNLQTEPQDKANKAGLLRFMEIRKLVLHNNISGKYAIKSMVIISIRVVCRVEDFD